MVRITTPVVKGTGVGQVVTVGPDGYIDERLVKPQQVLATSGPRIGAGGHGMQDSSTSANVAIPNFEAQLDAMVARGLDVYRMDISWMQWETSNNTYNTGYRNRWENCLRELKERSFKKIILTFIETPEWARPAHLLDVNKFWRPALMQDYADFLTYFCTLYKADAESIIIEVWNEPSFYASFWKSADAGALTQQQAATEYAEMLVRSHIAVKAVDSKFSVAGGVLHRAQDGYLQDMFDAKLDGWDIKNHFDFLDVHLYVSTTGSGAEGPYARQSDRSHSFKPGLDLMQEVLIRNGVGTQTTPFPIIITEYGWSDATINAANGDSGAHNEATTANRDLWTRQTLDILFSTPYRSYVKYSTIYTVGLHPSIEGETLFNGSYASPLPVFDSYGAQLAANGGSGSGGNVTQPDPPEIADVTVANTLTETIIYENVIPAAVLVPRTAIKVFLAGIYSTSGLGPLCTIKVYVNNVLMQTRATTSAAVTNTSIFTNILMTIRTAGALGTLQHVLWGMWNRNATDVAPALASSVDLTIPLAIKITATWSVAAAANTLTIQQAYTELVGN